MISPRIYHQLCDRYIETFFWVLLNENKFEIQSTNNETSNPSERLGRAGSLNSNA